MFIEIYCIRWKWFSWKVIHFGLKKLSFHSVTIKNGAMGKGMPSCTVLREMLTGAFNQTNLKHKPTVFTRQDTTQYIYQTKHNPLYLPDKRQHSIFTRQNTIHCIYQTRHNTVYLPDKTQHSIFTRQDTTQYILQIIHSTRDIYILIVHSVWRFRRTRICILLATNNYNMVYLCMLFSTKMVW